MSDTKKILLQSLKDIKHYLSDKGCENGLCSLLDEYWRFENPQDIFTRSCLRIELKALFVAWPQFSGNSGFPVPAPFSLKSALKFPLYTASEQIYRNYRKYETDMWSEHDDYGKLRRNLLDFCIKTLEEELSNESAID